jgi:flavin reductase (DIM6/NTAB) family NADH-FMN oxidoreductase RutF
MIHSRSVIHPSRRVSDIRVRYLLFKASKCAHNPFEGIYDTITISTSVNIPLAFSKLDQACVVPRPIGWISTLSITGAANLAPYSQFNNLTFDPPYVMFSANQTPSAQQKDTVINVEATGVFCWNLATYDLREEVNLTAEGVDSSVDEFEHASLEKEDSKIVQVTINGKKTSVPMVKRSPVRFECEHYSTLRLPGNPPMGAVDVVIGRVIGIHIDEGVLTDGKIDVRKTMPIARCGYYEYAVVQETFEMRIPGEGKAVLAGLEGSVKVNRELEQEKDQLEK